MTPTRLLLPLSALAALAIQSCHAPPQYHAAANPYSQGHTLAKTAASGAVEGRPTWSQPVRIPGRPELLFPYSVETRVRWYSDTDNFSEGGIAAGAARRDLDTSGGAIDSGPIQLRWHNAVVADVDSGEQWSLLDRRGVLSMAWIHRESAKLTGSSLVASPPPTTVLFQATTYDTNADGVLDDRDASRALLVDFEAKTARFVTPANARLHAVDFTAIPNAALLMLAQDLNGDGVFGLDEAPRPYLLDLRTGRAARPLIREEIVDDVQAHLSGA